MRDKVTNILNNKFPWVLIFTGLLSYFQTLRMYVWKDDNAIFFKFNHLSEPAGYLGRGLLGEGLYKFSVTPYYFVYKVFGYENIWAYYALNLMFILFAILSVYFLFRYLLSDKAGQIASFLYACGYIAAEGNYWLAASMIIHVSVILVGISLYFYVKFRKSNNYAYYVIALLYYFLSVHLTPVRVHYFAFVLLLYDLLTLEKVRKIRSWSGYLLRSIPIGTVFYYTYILNGDSRTSGVVESAQSILQGETGLLYSFFGTVGTIIIPDYARELYVNTAFQVACVGILFIILFSFVNKNLHRLLYLGGAFAWYIVSESIIPSVGVATFPGYKFIFFFGGLTLLLFSSLVINFKDKYRYVMLFLLIWFVGNLYAYTSYLPDSIYPSTSRYLSHSFLPFVGMFGLIASHAYIHKRKLVWYAIVSWGIANLFFNVRIQTDIVHKRSIPAANFHLQLKSHVHTLSEGDIVYVDVADQARGSYAHAFSVSQMPEETALAWRYGLDRYDIRLVNDYEELLQLLSEGSIENKQGKLVPINTVYSFFYEGSELVKIDQSDGLSDLELVYNIVEGRDGLEIAIDNYYPSHLPMEVTVSLKASSTDPSEMEFPFSSPSINTQSDLGVYKDQSLQKLAYEYHLFKKLYRENSIVSSTNNWNDNVPENVIDGNTETYWRAHRVEWNEDGALVEIDLGEQVEFSRLVWLNKHANSSPTIYRLEVSVNGESWEEVASITSEVRLEADMYQVAMFPSQAARYIRYEIVDTLNHDSAAISEIWIVPTKFDQLEIPDTEAYLKQPFAYVSNESAYTNTLQRFRYKGVVQLYWYTNKTNSFITSEESIVEANYNGSREEYEFKLPAGGTKLTRLKVVPAQIPGNVEIIDVNIMSKSTSSL